MAILYKIRDSQTNKFWNGDFRRSAFGDNGKTWKKRDSVEHSISQFLRYRNRFNIQTTHTLPDSWEIVEVQLVEKEIGSSKMDSLLHHLLLREELEKIATEFVYFADKMRSKKVLDQIQFLILLAPGENKRWVDMERIVEARSQIRGLGIKTRTFRESSGVFGMMDRQQALRARMTLDVKAVADLEALRNKLGI